MKGRISIAVLVMTMSAFAQTVNLKGVVKDRVSENPIKDAIVQIQGKSIADPTAGDILRTRVGNPDRIGHLITRRVRGHAVSFRDR